MIALVLALLQVAPALEPAPQQQDIEVLGTRLKKLRLDLAIGDGKLTGCRVSVTSGDKFIDAQACKGAYACVFSGVYEQRRLLSCINDRIIRAVQLDRLKKD